MNFRLGWTTAGEHQVIASLSETFSNISSFTPRSSQSLSGFCRWYGTGRCFWSTGRVSVSIYSLTSIFLTVFLSRKKPSTWNTLLYSFNTVQMLSSGVFTVLILRSLVSLSVPKCHRLRPLALHLASYVRVSWFLCRNKSSGRSGGLSLISVISKCFILEVFNPFSSYPSKFEQIFRNLKWFYL